jgi:hypothetical protein
MQKAKHLIQNKQRTTKKNIEDKEDETKKIT